MLFFDVLGFSNLVYNQDKTKIQEYFSYVEAQFHDHLVERNFNYLIISDSLVVSTDKSKESLSELIFIVGKIQYELFLKGILVRGAISFGELYINKSKNIIVGPGLINAYNLEKDAKYPRIVIDRRIIPELFDSTDNFIQYINSDNFFERYGEFGRIQFDLNLNDGMPYINFMRMVSRYGSTYYPKNIINIIAFFKKNYFVHQHFEKYNWLLKELIHELNLATDHYTTHNFTTSKTRLPKIKKLLDGLRNI